MNFTFSNQRQVLNRGVNGDNSFDLLHRLQPDVLNHQPDWVVIMVGTNDALNAGKLVAPVTYRSNLVQLVNCLKEKKIKVLLLTPPMVDDELAHFPNKENHTCNQLLQPYREIVMQVANATDSALLDMFDVLEKAGLPKIHLMNLENSRRNDGVHPTAEGYAYMARTVFEKLQQLGVSKQKIVCYGDSITFGYLVEGEGLETGESYPAVLNRLLLAK